MKYKQNYTLYKRGKYWYYRTYNNKGERTSGISTGQTSKILAQNFCDNLFRQNKLWETAKTFGEFAEHFYDIDSPFFLDRTKPLSRNSIISIQSDFRVHIYPYFKDMKLAKITPSLLKTYRIKLLEQIKTQHVVTIMQRTKYIMDSAFQEGLISKNPFDYLSKIQIIKEKKDAFTLEEIKLLYKNCETNYKNNILVMTLCGLRRSECLGLTSEDVHQSNAGFSYIHLYRQLCKLRYSNLKNKEERNIPIIDELIECIADINPRYKSATDFTPFINSLIPDAEKRKLTNHSFRHFFITQANADGIPEIKVKILAGHSLSGMNNIYVNMKVEDLTEILAWQKKIYDYIVN